MKVLFVHDNFPAQFGAFGQWLRGLGDEVVFATARADAPEGAMPLLRYAPHREPTQGVHPYAQGFETAAIRGQGFVRAALKARAEGFRPDVVMAHSGWGAGMFAADVFPQAACVPYVEWWYRHPAPDAAFLDAEPGAAAAAADVVEAPMRQRVRNAPMLMDLSAAHAALTPTRFQAAQFPPLAHGLLRVLHDGIDAAKLAPGPVDRTLGGLVAEDAEVVTYATRGMEPHRGFPQAMRALASVLARRPKAVGVIVGENRVAYGGQAARGVDWKARMLEETAIDPARLRFTGLLPRPALLAAMRRSDAHLYLTAPFVLSWSMLEAMSVGCPLIASDTDPVREFAEDGATARLVPFFDHAALADAVDEALEDRAAATARGAAARAMVLEQLDAARLWPEKRRWLAEVRAGLNR